MARMRGAAWGASVLGLALAIAACGGGSGDSAGEGDGGNGRTEGGAQSLDGVSIIATGAIEGLGLGPDAWGYGIMIENSNAAAQNVELRVYAFDAGGTLIDTSKTVLIAVQAQSRGAAVGQLIGVRPDQDVASVDVVIESVEPSWFGSSTITIADASQNGNVVTGVVSTDAGKDLVNSSVQAIIIDSSGTIVGGGVDVEVIAAAGTTPFEVVLSGELSEGELVVLASPSGVEL